MDAVAGRINYRRRDENHQVSFAGRAALTLEQPSEERKVAEERNLVLDPRDVFGDEAAQNNRLAVPNNSAGRDHSQADTRQRKLRGNRNGPAGDTSRLSLR